MANININDNTPLIGILCWEEGCSPRGLVQLEKLVGNSTNPESFEFTIKYSRVKGANIHTILENPCQKTLQSMINEAQIMEKQGIKAITTSCGFNAVFQRELSDSVNIPVFTSSLMQVPLVHHMLTEQQSVGIITAKKSALSEKHLENAGITKQMRVQIKGLEDCSEWNVGINIVPTRMMFLIDMSNSMMDGTPSKWDQTRGALDTILTSYDEMIRFGLDLFPVRGWEINGLGDYLHYVTVPTLCTVFVALGYNTRFYRAVIAEEIDRDHVRTMKAYGCPSAKMLSRSPTC